MDVVYRIRRGEHNEPLRYSLRSLRNLPHDRVWIVGHRPAWVRNVGHIPTTQKRSKYENSVANVVAACAHPDITGEFVMMDDDFHVMQRVERIPDLHRGPFVQLIDRYVARGVNGSYVKRLRAGLDLLRRAGFDDPLCYELHMPMRFEKARMCETLKRFEAGSGLPYRTLYGNQWAIGGERVPDCKVHAGKQSARFAPDTPVDDEVVKPIILATPFVSTNRAAFAGKVGKWIRREFPDPSPYEFAPGTRAEYRNRRGVKREVVLGSNQERQLLRNGDWTQVEVVE